MQHFAPDDLKFFYSADHTPIGTVQPGEQFVVDTEDCFTGRFRTPEGFTPENLAWVIANLDGVTGPIAVEGATPDHVVAITLHEVEITTPGSILQSALSHGPRLMTVATLSPTPSYFTSYSNPKPAV